MLHPFSCASFLVASLTTMGCLAAQARVFTVDDDAPADFTTIQAAIDAAAPGDVVLVKDGDYVEFAIDGKGISVVADRDASVRVLGTAGSMTSVVRNVPAGQRAVVRGLELVMPVQISGPAFEISGCAGVVLLEDVRTAMASVLVLSGGQRAALEVDASDRVVIARCDFVGSPPGSFSFGGPGARGLYAEQSSVFVHGGSLEGSVTFVAGGLGPPGVEVFGGELVLRDTAVRGGGGGSVSVCTSQPGRGGRGLVVDGGATASAIGASLSGGMGGVGGLGSCQGPNGFPSQILNGSLQEVSAVPTELQSPSIVRDDVMNEDIDFVLTSEPQAPAFLLVMVGATDPVFFGPGLGGFLGVGIDPIVASLGSTDANGQLRVGIGVPTLPMGFDTWNATAQVVVASPMRLDLSNPTVFTIVDETR